MDTYSLFKFSTSSELCHVHKYMQAKCPYQQRINKTELGRELAQWVKC